MHRNLRTVRIARSFARRCCNCRLSLDVAQRASRHGVKTPDRGARHPHSNSALRVTAKWPKSGGMFTRLIKAFTREKKKAAALEARIAKNLKWELAELPEFYGFDSLANFLKAVERAHSGTSKKKVGRKITLRTGKRAKITAAIRAKVKRLLQQGKSGSQVAKAVGISLPSVYNIKKTLKPSPYPFSTVKP